MKEEFPSEGNEEAGFSGAALEVMSHYLHNRISEDEVIRTILVRDEPDFKRELIDLIDLCISEFHENTRKNDGLRIPDPRLKEHLIKNKDYSVDRLRELQERIGRIIV
jgi:hypothetical protein